MSSINIGLLGFGTVGKGVYETIQTHQDRLQFFLGKPVKIVAVLVRNLTKHPIQDSEILLTDSFEEMMKLEELDVVIDAIVGTEPGYTYIKRAIERNCHVITANKEMFAHHGQELLSLAKNHQVSVGFEATVGGGIPVIQTLRKLLKINRITKIEGIMNGTSNFILTSMREEGLSFEETLAIAQEKGYAEADPTNDIEGFDAYFKALVLSDVAFGALPEKENIIRKGITNITQEQIQLAVALGLKFKHVVKLEKQAGRIQCEIQPILVPVSHPFYSIEGVQNAVSIHADIVGNISLVGPGAGKFPTASAVIEDLLHLYQEQIPSYFNCESESTDQKEEMGQWLIFNQHQVQYLLPQTLEKVELSDQVLYVKGQEEEIRNFESQYPDANLYSIEGLFQFSKETILA
jgi:homoserine dehydrogenase